MPNTVYFVGAGPGAVDLITVRGMNLLAKADVIIYAGSLVNKKILDYKKESCQIHNSATMTLDEVISVIEQAVKNNNMVVRLHTGDPSIYGAIREQMDALAKLSIAYEVVPGVSSFLGAGAALKTEYTLPGVTQTIILTRMGGRTKVPVEESIEKLASHQATMVVFLSASMLSELSGSLIKGGYSAAGKAAIVYKATWDDEIIVRTTVAELAQAAADNNIKKTALIIIGECLGNEYELSKLYAPNFSHGFRNASQ